MAASMYPPPPPFYRLYKDYAKNPDSAPAPPPPITGAYTLFGASYTTDDVLPGLEEQGVRQLYPKGPNIVLQDSIPNPNTSWRISDVCKCKFCGPEYSITARSSYPITRTLKRKDYKKELKALNRELLFQMLELADVLVERPSQYARRVEDLALIFKNLFHLLNSLRPYQARSTLIHILESQIERRKEAIADIRRRRAEAREMLKESCSLLDGHSA